MEIDPAGRPSDKGRGIMAYIPYNVNPVQRRVEDCTVRAIAMVEDRSWLQVYYGICATGAALFSMPMSNEVWGEYLYRIGYDKFGIPNTCPRCYTVRDFCHDHPYGRYILGTGSHVIAVINGDWFDTWNSGDEVPLFYFRKGI